MLVQKWGILRAAMPPGIEIKKTIGLVMALMKLHNFCITEVDRGGAGEDVAARTSSAVDTFHIVNQLEGFIPLDNMGDEVIPTQLLGAGNHFVDVPRNSRATMTATRLPRAELHDKVLSSHRVRPSTRPIRGN